MTTRAELEGTLARWFAVDANEHVAVFTGAYALWPLSVFDAYPLVDVADQLLDILPAVTRGVVQTDRAGELAVREAECGLYSFSARDDYNSTVYTLDAVPEAPLQIGEVPEEIRDAANLVKLPGVRFAQLDAIDLPKLVPTAT